MKAMLMTERGGPEVLHISEFSDPSPQANEVLVRVRATALNHLDIWVRKGAASPKLPLPHILGCDIAGEIIGFGPQAQDTAPGMQGGTGENLTTNMRVMVNPGLSCGSCKQCLTGRDNLCRSYKIIGEHTRGGYCEFISVPRQNIIPIPENISYTQAAAIPLAALTAWQMVVDKARVQPGEHVLIMAAGSGVSTWAIQIAKMFGAIVIATASTDAKLEQAKQLGADHTINYVQDDYTKICKNITGGAGVDVAIDHTGAQNWEKTIKATSWGGRIVTCGATSGMEASTPLAHIFFRQLSILGSTMGSKGDLIKILQHVERGTLKPIVSQVLPLADARAAHERMESREFFGKLVLEI